MDVLFYRTFFAADARLEYQMRTRGTWRSTDAVARHFKPLRHAVNSCIKVRCRHALPMHDMAWNAVVDHVASSRVAGRCLESETHHAKTPSAIDHAGVETSTFDVGVSGMSLR